MQLIKIKFSKIIGCKFYSEKQKFDRTWVMYEPKIKCIFKFMQIKLKDFFNHGVKLRQIRKRTEFIGEAKLLQIFKTTSNTQITF